jgi:hypothetical protein
MVMKRFGNRKFHATNEKAEEGLGFFLLGLGQKGEIFLFFFKNVPKCSHQVPKVFLSGFQVVPQIIDVFPNMLPKSLHVLSHIIWPWFNFNVYNL